MGKDPNVGKLCTYEMWIGGVGLFFFFGRRYRTVGLAGIG